MRTAEHQSEAAVAVAAAMAAKRDPSGDEMRGSGGRARARRIEDGETDHPSAAELRASLSTRDQVRACVRWAPARTRVLQRRLLHCVNIRTRGIMVSSVSFALVRRCSFVLGYCGLQEIEEMRRRLRKLEKLEFEIPRAASHGNSAAKHTIFVCL